MPGPGTGGRVAGSRMEISTGPDFDCKMSRKYFSRVQRPVGPTELSLLSSFAFISKEIFSFWFQFQIPVKQSTQD